MKTFGILVAPRQEWYAESRQVRVIVAAKTKKAAVEALQAQVASHLTYHFFTTYGGETWNEVEIEAAEARPGVVFWAEDHGRSTVESYKPVDAKSTVVFGAMKGGPIHLEQDEPAGHGLSWCGVKSQFRHWTRPGSVEDVTCPRCLRQIRQDRPLAWGGK